MPIPIREIAEQYFKVASGEAALFELRMRLLCGAIPSVADISIEENLSSICDVILDYYKISLSSKDIEQLKKACTVRNKLLHCEFSTVRQHLNVITPKVREGGVTRVNIGNLSAALVSAKIKEIVTGNDGGQEPISDTKTKTLKDIFGWLLECQNAGEFQEATKVFQDASTILDRIRQG